MFVPTHKLRFIKRKWENILQQRWSDTDQWRDVPCEPEPPKTEREAICDEIVDLLNKYDSPIYRAEDTSLEELSPIFKHDIIAKIKQIRDKERN